ncbi:MAG: DoxX-like family protein [Planctomycetes bacterium]|nr:DoxX-like family protein [Planctomycetota bacterium]
MGIYVEIRIRGTIAELVRRTQTPDLHARWDLRFTDIEYLPRPDEDEPQRFLYATRIGFGLAVRGTGETVGRHDADTGEQTSALKFYSDDAHSLIRQGAGYWRYVPTDDGVLFITYYDYRVRFGVLGRAFDALVFRPLLGWATAWSFDRLRLWIEKGIDPALSLQRSLTHAIARAGLACVWLYQGIVPKLLAAHVDELALIQEAGISDRLASLALQALGWSEVFFGIAMLCCFRQRWHFVLTLLLVGLATADVALNSPRFLSAAFNPVSLNVLMATLALIGWNASRDLPSPNRCRRTPAKRGVSRKGAEDAKEVTEKKCTSNP